MASVDGAIPRGSDSPTRSMFTAGSRLWRSLDGVGGVSVTDCVYFFIFLLRRAALTRPTARPPGRPPGSPPCRSPERSCAHPPARPQDLSDRPPAGTPDRGPPVRLRSSRPSVRHPAHSPPVLTVRPPARFIPHPHTHQLSRTLDIIQERP